MCTNKHWLSSCEPSHFLVAPSAITLACPGAPVMLCQVFRVTASIKLVGKSMAPGEVCSFGLHGWFQLVSKFENELHCLTPPENWDGFQLWRQKA